MKLQLKTARIAPGCGFEIYNFGYVHLEGKNKQLYSDGVSVNLVEPLYLCVNKGFFI